MKGAKTSLRRGRLEEAIQFWTHLFDVARVDGEKVFDLLRESRFELPHLSGQLEAEMRWKQTIAFIRPRQGDLVEVLANLPGQRTQRICRYSLTSRIVSLNLKALSAP